MAANFQVRAKWTVLEELTLVRAVFDREEILFGSMSGSGAIKLTKQRAAGWQEVADLLNSQFCFEKRDQKDVKKKFYNLKAKAKQRYDELKHPKTGGGALKPLSQSEELLMSFIGNRASVCGVDGGVETCDTNCIAVTEPLPIEESNAVPEVVSTDSIANETINAEADDTVDGKTDTSETPAKRISPKGRKATKRAYEELATSTLEMDQTKMTMEMELIKLKIEEKKRQISLLDYLEKKAKLEIEMLNERKSYMNVKKELLEMQIKSTTDFKF